MSDKYNGLTNYETWWVALWLGNEQCHEENILEIARDTLVRFPSLGNNEPQIALSQRLKEYVEELPEIADVTEKATMAADLLGAALSEVRWCEIAKNYIDAANEE